VSPFDAARDITRSINAALPDPAARVATVPVDGGNESLLSEPERERAVGFRFPKRKGEWTAGRAAARLALRDLVGSAAEDFTVDTGPAGEPVVKSRSGPAKVGVSISHAGGVAAAVAFPLDRPIGLDLEPIVKLDSGLATLACDDRERGWLAGRSPDRSDESLLRIWTAKEAAVKLTGTGLGVPLIQVRIESGDSDFSELQLRVPASAAGGEAHCRARVVTLTDWVAAVAWYR
jgi:4'-phosphopantetheinyl transferase